MVLVHTLEHLVPVYGLLRVRRRFIRMLLELVPRDEAIVIRVHRLELLSEATSVVRLISLI